MSTPTARDRAVARHLGVLYGHSGFAADLIQPDLTTTQLTVIMRVSEAEEGVDGASVEARIKGYGCQIQTTDLTGLTGPFTGSRLELADDRTFDGHTAFDVDADPLSFGRGGHQRLLKLSAAPDVADADLV